MSGLRKALEEYLAVRRALGFKLRLAGAALEKFVSFLDQERAAVITTELALRWAMQPAEVQPEQWANRLSMVRGFALYRSGTDPKTEIPPQGLLPYRYRRKRPYIYNDSEIRQLLKAAERLPSATGLRAKAYSTLFGLLAVTGMRISEVIGLDDGDVDWADGVLTVRESKFGKSRLVPMHPSTRGALRQYARSRNRIYPKPKSQSFFVSDRGVRLTDCTVRWTFVRLSHQIGLRSPSDRRGPRLHDFRHRFAVQTLTDWYRGGVDVEKHMAELAAYLGHAHVTDTYWYLTATPELLRLAATRLDNPGGVLFK